MHEFKTMQNKQWLHILIKDEARKFTQYGHSNFYAIFIFCLSAG